MSLFLFWVPGVIIVAGALLALLSKQSFVRRVASAMVLFSMVAVLTTPWTIPTSPSSAFGHFLGSLLGPIVFLCVGLYCITFSGNVPVGRLSSTDRILGIGMVGLGAGWFLAMHWWSITPTYDGTVNAYWVMFWSTFLLAAPAIGMGLMVLVRTFGEDRRQEMRVLGVVSASLLLIGLFGVTADGSSVERGAFSKAVWLAFADVLGLVVGLALALLMFAVVLAVYERQLVQPVTSKGPSKEHLDRVAFVLEQHVDGGELSEE